VLLALRGRALHGYAIKKEVHSRSDGHLNLDAGGLYRLIARLEAMGAVRVAAAPTDAPVDDRKRVFYRLTAAGERLLTADARRLASLVASPDVASLLAGARR
jgi:DNA-binding PadR family transcriptional regulator